MIHANRVVTVGEQESIIDRPIILYRGDREVEIEFELVGNEFTFSEEGNLIKSVNASHGQLVLNTPSGEHMFSELAECHEGKVVFVVTKEMIDEFIEMGFYSFQIRLYDSVEMKSRVTIPPVLSGFDIRNPIAAEDETNVVDQGIVDYARIFKDQSDEELPTFDWTGAYNKTEWAHHDVITENKMNKIEDALYSINANIKESDIVMLNALDNVKKDADKYVKEHMAEVEADVDEFERNLNTGVEKFKVDTNAAMTTHKNEVSEELESVNSQLAQIKNDIVIITPSMSISEINNKLLKQGTYLFKKGLYNFYNDDKIIVNSNSHLIFEKGSYLKQCTLTNTHYDMIRIRNIENVVIDNVVILGERDDHIGTDGEWGYGIAIYNSHNITINNAYIEKTWGDGIYIGCHYDDVITVKDNTNIVINNAVIKDCSRNGISICSSLDVTINHAKISGINRIAPTAAIDIEPEHSTTEGIFLGTVKIHDLYVERCGYGLHQALNSAIHNKRAIIDIDKVAMYNCEHGFNITGLGLNDNEGVFDINVGEILVNNVVGEAMFLNNYNKGISLNVDTLKIVGRSDTNTYGHGSAMWFTNNFETDYDDNEAGKVQINNVDVLDYDNKFKYILYVEGKRVYNSVKINNLKTNKVGYCYGRPLFNLEKCGDETYVKNNAKCIMDYETPVTISRKRFATNYVLNNLTQVVNYTIENMIDGEYTIQLPDKVLPHALHVTFNGYSFSYGDKTNLTKMTTVHNATSITFIKDGSRIYISDITGQWSFS